MSRPKLTDAQLAVAPKEQRRETLKKRAQRDRKKAAVLHMPPPPLRVTPEAVPPSELVFGLELDDLRGRAMYLDLRRRLLAAGRWSGEATHGLLLTYVKTTREIERAPAFLIAAPIMTAQSKAAAALKLLDLPPEKARPKGSDRFGGDW